MSRQLDLIGKPKRKSPRVLMRVCDAGCGDSRPIVQFRCAKCDYQSGWFTFDTVAEAKRGLPCPKCNEPQP